VGGCRVIALAFGHTGTGEAVPPSFGSEEVSGIPGLLEFVGWWIVVRFALKLQHAHHIFS